MTLVATKKRFCQQAILIEVAYCNPVYPEDDLRTDNELLDVV